MSTFAENLKALRLSRGYSQAKFAKAIGSKQTTVSSWERGEKTPDWKTMADIATQFGLPENYLMPYGTSGSEPETIEAKIISRGIDKLPKEQRERALTMYQVMFEPQFAHLFTKENDDDDT